MRRFILVPALLVVALPASAQTHRRTVLDYFKMLPSGWFSESGQPRMKQLREGFNSEIPASRRSVVDLKNDFLRFNADAIGLMDVAVFRFQGRDTVAVLSDYEGTTLSFWRPQNGHLVEVTKQVFPFRFQETVTHVLPRRGTTIQILRGGWPSQSQTILARFLWRGGRFMRS